MSRTSSLRPILLLAVLPTLRAQAPNAYVDARLCAACHPAIAKSYALTGMAKSFYRLTPQTVVEDFTKGNPFHHEPSGAFYSMIQRDGAYYQRRWRTGYAGGEADVEESRIDYVMGSGNHVRTYLHRTARGALVELPLAWYPENGGMWAMNPGHDRDYMLPPRTIAYECMACHNAYPKIPAGHDEPGSEPLYSGALPEGIDCQRCHGPGGNHVRAAQAKGPNLEAVRVAIVNPARLTPDRQMEVCMQCHLETTSMPLPHSIQRYGRRPFSYKPGEPLGNYQIFFDHAPGSPYREDFEIVSSVYRLRQSQCFLRSAGKLTCTTCHNPHDVPRGEAAAAHYNGVCTRCHAETLRRAAESGGTHPGSPDCTGCHMVKRRTRDAVHAVMTDHRIERRPAPSDLQTPLAERPDSATYRGEVVPYYPSPLPSTGENALYVAIAQVTQESNLEKGLPKLAAEMVRQKPARPEFYTELGGAWLLAHKPANAVAAFEEALKREPNSPVVLVNLADALTEDGNLSRAATVLDGAVKTVPGDPLLWYQLGIVHSRQGRQNDAVAAFERAISLDPDMAEAHNLLAVEFAAQGEMDRVEGELRRALQINPDLPEAQGNLAHLFALRGDLPQAAFYFARSVRLKPNDADVRVNYAVTLAGLTRWQESLQQIEAALKADPKSPDAHNFRGALLERQGNSEEALREFLEAVRLNPSFDRAHLNAGLNLARSGKPSAAEPHLRQATKSADPNVQRQAEAALRQLGR